MELKDDLRGKRVYFDAGIFVYLLDGFENSQPLSDLKDLIANNEIEVFTSIMTYCEIIPSSENADLMENIENFINAFNPSEISKKSLSNAGILRGRNELSTETALHIMTAVENECDVILTNDQTMIATDGLKLIQFSDYENKPSKDLESNPISKHKKNSLEDKLEKAKMEKFATIKARDNSLLKKKGELAQLEQEVKDMLQQQHIISSEIKDIEELEEELKKEELEEELKKEEIKNGFNS